MSVSGVGTGSALSIQSLVDMRSRLGLLQQQLGTGKKSDTYAGLGLDRGLTVSLRAQLSAISGFQDAVSQVGVRLDLAQTALTQMADISRGVKTTALVSPFQLSGGNQTTDQKTSMTQFDLLVGLLNTQAGDRYLFSGRAVDRAATETSNAIVEGDSARAGLKQIIAERRQADLGADGLGRLVLSAPSATSVQIAEDHATSPFGFKLSAVGGTLSGATYSGPAGAPAAVSVDLGVTNPAAGETVRFTFALPDGTTADLTLTATDTAPPGPNEFTLGASPAASAANLQAALTTALGNLGSTALTAASAMAAGENFFNIDDANPPQRVAGPPFDTATALVDGTAANTVSWYTGEAGSEAARTTALARADQTLALSYGMRANEQSLRQAMLGVAVFASVSFSPSDPQAGGAYEALKSRVVALLDGPPNQQRIADIQSELAGVQTALAAAGERHKQTSVMIGDFTQEVEGISQEEVAARILSLQTSLQATLQTTAMLLRTSLINFL